jgi:hypothetical protein
MNSGKSTLQLRGNPPSEKEYENNRNAEAVPILTISLHTIKLELEI